LELLTTSDISAARDLTFLAAEVEYKPSVGNVVRGVDRLSTDTVALSEPIGLRLTMTEYEVLRLSSDLNTFSLCVLSMPFFQPLFSYPESGGSIVLRSVSKDLPVYMVP
jgi:hypothetical protein